MGLCLCGGNIEGYTGDIEDYSQGGMCYPKRSWVRVAKVVGELCGAEVLWKTEWLTHTGDPNINGPYVWTNGAYLVAHPPLFCGRAGRMSPGILRVKAEVLGTEYGPIDLKLTRQSRTWIDYTAENYWLTSGLGSVAYMSSKWRFGGFSYQCTYLVNELIVNVGVWPSEYRPDLLKLTTDDTLYDAFYYNVYDSDNNCLASGYSPGCIEDTSEFIIKLGEYGENAYFHKIDIKYMICTDGLPNLHTNYVWINGIWLSSC